MEQDTVNPSNGWKAYYAATKAIVNVNAEFYNIIRERSLPAMSRFWLNADYVKCIHASGELFTGYAINLNFVKFVILEKLMAKSEYDTLVTFLNFFTSGNFDYVFFFSVEDAIVIFYM